MNLYACYMIIMLALHAFLAIYHIVNVIWRRNYLFVLYLQWHSRFHYRTKFIICS